MSDSNKLSSSITGKPLSHLGKASFSVSSRVALQLGRESISSSITAIVELVKNAYDADAELVRIRFANAGTKDVFMVIEDTGDGMSIDQLRGHWMVIGTANKTRRRKTTKQRTVTGEKGLGRLGLDRLCASTEVESIQLGSVSAVRLEVQWDRYENEDYRLETVEHDLYSLPDLRLDPITGKERDYPKGTRLILRGLKDQWDHESILQLRNELALLVSPFQGPNDFTIEVDTAGIWPQLDGSIMVQEPLLDAANWKVIATINDESLMEIVMTSARHETEYHFKPTPWSDAVKKQGDHPKCGPVRMEFYFFPRKDAELATKTLKAGEIVDFLKFNQGIRIYRDEFRVKPYGEPDGSGDWLRLAFRRMQSPEGVSQEGKQIGGWRLGLNQVAGAVFITHEKNPELNDQTNREGLLQGKAFEHLNIFALKVVRFFEIQNQVFERGRKTERVSAEKADEQAKNSIEEVNKAIHEIGALTARMPDLAALGDGTHGGVPSEDDVRKVITDVKRHLENATTGLKQSAKLFMEAEEQKNTMANLASLGILAASFGHETLDWTGTVVKNTRWLLDNMSNGLIFVNLDVKEEIGAALSDTANEAQKIRKFARFTIGNLNRDKRQRKDFSLTKTINGVFEAFDDVLRTQRNTEIDLSGIPSTPCLINGYEMDWESIVVNLITNASWALEDRPAANRRIKAKIENAGPDWLFVFDDSGVGLEAGTEEMVFFPAYSTKRSARGEVIGTGMGLFIVKSFVEDHSNGIINVRAHGELGGACFEIRVPKAKSQLS